MNFDVYKKAWVIMKTNYRYMSYSMFFELLFFFSYGLFVIPILDQAISFVSFAIATMSERAVTLTTGTALFDLFFSEAIRPYTYKILLLFSLAFVVLYLLYCFFEGQAWRFAHNSVHEQKGAWQYISLFTKRSLFWFILFIVYKLISFFMLLWFTIGKPASPDTISSPFFWLLDGLFLLGIIYPAFLSYTIPFHYSWKEVTKKSYALIIQKKNILLLFFLLLFFVAIAYIIKFILIGANLISQDLYSIAGITLIIILIFPYLFYTRLCFILTNPQDL